MTEDLLKRLLALANPDNVAGMARFGINPERTLGVSIPEIRKLAKGVRDHALAQRLWDSGYHEARILASLVDDPKQVTPDQMEQWAADFDSWDVVDQVCGNLFERSPHALDKIFAWSQREEEFVKRAAFSLMAYRAVHDKNAPDALFASFLPVIAREATDERNFVRKAVNWALRQIGKRNPTLRLAALETAHAIARIDSRAARWIAADAIRELSR